MLKARYVLAALALTLVILITLEASGRTQMATLRLATASFGLASWIRFGHEGGADGTGPEEQSADGKIALEKPSVPSFGMASWIRSGDEAGAGGKDGAGPQEQSTDGRVLQEESSVPASSCPQESSCSKEFGGHCPHSLSLFCDVKRSLEVALDFTPHQEARDWLMHRTCAFVSSSGANRFFRNGNEIDSHDVVFRVNMAPVKKQFRDYVGMKNSVRVLEKFTNNKSWCNHRKWLRTHVRQHNVTDPWLYIPAVGGRLKNEHIVTPMLPDAVKKNVAFAWPLTKGTTEDQTNNQTVVKLEELLRTVFPDNMGKGKGGKHGTTYHPTTGAVAIIFALTACRSVDAYGMHAPPHAAKVPYSYWSRKGSANSNGWHGLLRSEHELWARLSVDPAAGRRTGKLTLPGFDCIDCSGVLPQAPIYTSLFSE